MNDMTPPPVTKPVRSSDEMPTLSAFFEGNIDLEGRDSNWLRESAFDIIENRRGDAPCLEQFAKRWLARNLLFGPAAKIYALALDKYGRDKLDVFSNALRQQLAVATYKNEEAPTRRRLEAALAILIDIRPLQEGSDITKEQMLADGVETAALRGAVYRRLWELDSKPQYLQKALEYYRASHELDMQRETANITGYGGINAVYLLDALAHHFRSIGDGPILQASIAKAVEESRLLRGALIERLEQRLALPGQHEQAWLCETLACAYLGFGLACWRDAPERAKAALLDAQRWTELATQTQSAEWMRETTHSHWLRIAHFNEPKSDKLDVLDPYWNAAAEVINVFRVKPKGTSLSGRELAESARRGKVGLALSGGGFRASFYHIGVLARLADVDALRHIDVLSTVSGGSIVGAHYYLLLRELLSTNPKPQREDYIALVKELKRQFCSAVDRNLRMRGLSDLRTTFKLLFKSDYTRSNRMAELYDEMIYKPAAPALDKVTMQSLHVTPAGEESSFNPRFSNWRRCAHVPALLINATCLNTGHSWHFTNSWMGEPPELIGNEVDKNERLRRVPYKQAGEYETLTLGFAVAASACVPGIFEPLRLPKLYPGRLVRLVDGGVHDNQGVDALIGQGCDLILCSDGSGQMNDELHPENGPVGTPKRSMDILMKRVREAEHADIENRVMRGTRKGLFFVHLKQGLPADDISWAGCKDRTPAAKRTTPSYGVDSDVQSLLSQLRTDLDSFSEVETSALMVSGYNMTLAELQRLNQADGARDDPYPWGGFDVNAQKDPVRWDFLHLESTMATPGDAKDVMRQDLGWQLRAGKSLFFKHLKLTPGWLTAVGIGGFIAAVLLVTLVLTKMNETWASLNKTIPITYWHALLLLVVAGIAFAVPRWRVWCIEAIFAVLGAVASNVFFIFGVNKRFLARGKLQRLLDMR